MNDKTSYTTEEEEVDNHIPVLQDTVIPGGRERRSEPVLTPDTLQQFAQATDSTETEQQAPLQNRELEAIMTQTMEELRQELDQRISGIIQQALEDTLRSTLRQQEEQLKQRLTAHLELRLSELLGTRGENNSPHTPTPGSDSDPAEV